MSPRHAALLLAAAALLCMSWPTPALSDGPGYVCQNDTYVSAGPDGNLGSVPGGDEAACAAACDATPGCTLFVLEPGGGCSLQKVVVGTIYLFGLNSGRSCFLNVSCPLASRPADPPYGRWDCGPTAPVPGGTQCDPFCNNVTGSVGWIVCDAGTWITTDQTTSCGPDYVCTADLSAGGNVVETIANPFAEDACKWQCQRRYPDCTFYVVQPDGSCVLFNGLGGGGTDYVSAPGARLCVRDVSCSTASLPSVAPGAWPGSCSGDAGSRCVATCPAGMAGNPTVFCEDGSWTPVAGSSCLVTCGAPFPPAATNASSWPASCNGTTTPGTCIANCSSGFSGSASMACLADGQWGNVSSSCAPVTCGTPFPPAAANAAAWPASCNGTASLGTCTASCLAGFTGSASMACLATGAWGNLSNTCAPVPVPCSLRVEPKRGPNLFTAGDSSGINLAELQLFDAAGGQINHAVLAPTAAFSQGTWRGNPLYAASVCFDNVTSLANNTCLSGSAWPVLSVRWPCAAGLSRVVVWNRANPSLWTRINNYKLVAVGPAGTPLQPDYAFTGGLASYSVPVAAPTCVGSFPPAAANASAWPASCNGTRACTVSCAAGFVGSASMACLATGVWGTPSSNCTPGCTLRVEPKLNSTLFSATANSGINLAEVQLFDAAGAQIDPSTLAPLARFSQGTYLNDARYAASFCFDNITSLSNNTCLSGGTWPVLSLSWPCAAGLSRVVVWNRFESSLWPRIRNYKLVLAGPGGPPLRPDYSFVTSMPSYSISVP